MKKLSDIHPNPDNPRLIRDADFRKLKNSIHDSPWMMKLRPIIIDENAMILAGRQRFDALKALKYKEVPDEWILNASDLTEEQKKEFIVKDNTHAGQWDWNILGENYDGFKLEEWGLTAPEWSDEEAGHKARTIKNVTEDNYGLEEDKLVTDIQPGDIFTIGEHRLLCGDSENIEDVRILMNGKRAGLVIADTPYGIDYESNWKAGHGKIDNDDVFLTGWIPHLHEVSFGFVFIFSTWRVLPEWMAILKDFSPLTNTIVWNKGGGGMGDLRKTFSTDYELILTFNRGHALRGKRTGSVWNIPRDSPATYLHPTQKPITLSARMIDSTCGKTDIVFSPFGGSGPDILAAHQLGRPCYVMEKKPKYCQAILERLLKLDPRLAITRNGQPWLLTASKKKRKPSPPKTATS